MSLNANKIPSTGGNRPPQANLKPGAQAARVVQVIDLGVQPQRPYQGQEKPPAHMISLTYELTHAFMQDEDGQDIEDKPRWISEDFPFYSLDQDKARSTKRYNAIDAEGECGGDFTLLVGRACQVVIVNNPGKGKNAGKVYDNIADVMPGVSMPGYTQPDLVNDPKVFELDTPDLEVFRSMPEWIQEKIKGNLEYQGSALQTALGGKVEAPKAPEEADDDSPY